MYVVCKVIVEMHGGSMGCISPAVFETESCIKGRGSDGSGSNSPRAIIQSTINMGAPESCVEMNVGANGGDVSAAARSNYADVEEGKGGTTFFVELPVNEMYNNEKNSIISNHLVKIMPIYGGNGAFGASGDVDSRSPKRKPTTSERQEQSRENVDNRDRMTESEMMTPVVNRYDFMSNIRDESGASGASGASSRVSAESANADFAHIAAIVRPKGPGLEEPMVADNPGCVGVGIGHSDTSPMAVRNTDSTPPPNATNMNFTPSSKPIAIGNYRPVDHTTTSDPIPIPW